MTVTGIMPCSLLVCVLLAAAPLSAETAPPAVDSAPATQPTAPALAAAPASQPSETPEGAPVEAQVIKVKGRAQHAPAGTAVTDAAAWQPVQLDDRYPAGTLVRTGLGSHVILQFGTEEPYTVCMVERMTLASLASLYKTATDKVSHVNVNYGAVRGGVSEGGLRSSFVVDSTVATLTKRGTWGFRLFVERGTGRYTISLADAGMVRALNRLTNKQQSIYGGQYVNESMIRWVDQTSFDRLVSMQDRAGLTMEEFQVKAFSNTGLAVIEPAPTPNSIQDGRPGYQQFVSQQVLQTEQQRAQDLQNIINILNPPAPGTITRPEGNFNGAFH